MSLHDAYARITPFEIAFPHEGSVEDLAQAVMEEASSRGVDPELPGIFITLGSVNDFVRDVLAPDASEGALQRYAALLFQAVQFVRAGRPLYLLDTSATRRLVDDVPSALPRPVSAAGYLQLPQHLFWMGGPGEAVPESVDGLFWFESEREVMHVLPITGVLPDGPGFKAVPLPEAPSSDAPQWMDADMRGDAGDYTSALPGHDLDRLYSVETAGEVFKLLARFFAYLDSAPAPRITVTAPDASESPGTPPEAPQRSALAYTRVALPA
jgi:hypothetical protein